MVDASGSKHELTQNVDSIGDIRMSYAKVDKTASNMAMASGILNRNTICGTKTKVKIHESVHRTVINKTSTIKEILNVFVLERLIAIRCGGDLIPRKKLRGPKSDM